MTTHETFAQASGLSRDKQNATLDLSQKWLRHLREAATTNVRVKYTKIKRGLPGFVNKNRVSAIADTGSAQNVMSFAYASDMKLPINYASSSFGLGNSKTIQSIGKLIPYKMVSRNF